MSQNSLAGKVLGGEQKVLLWGARAEERQGKKSWRQKRSLVGAVGRKRRGETYCASEESCTFSRTELSACAARGSG